MRPHEIEAWVLNIVDRVVKGQPVEDTRVELKAKWPEPERAARRIAGHANASRGASILWIIGLDEDMGVVGVDRNDLAEWLPRVSSCFDQLAPSVTDLNVPVGNATVVALLFDTLRAPYVVKNPAHGQRGGGPVSLEVPWRDGTSVRSARRQDLLTVLSPLEALPALEALRGRLTASDRIDPTEEEYLLRWELHFELYAEIPDQPRIDIPFHRCRAHVKVPEASVYVELTGIRLWPPQLPVGIPTIGPRSLSLTIEGTPDEVLLSGPGRLNLSASGFSPPFRTSETPAATVVLLLGVAGIDRDVRLDVELPFSSPGPDDRFRWEVGWD